MTQLTIDELEKRLDRTLYAVGAFADRDWYSEANEAVKVLIRRGNAFTTDDVWKLLEHTGLTTPEPRALGSIIRIFAKDKKIKPTGGYVKSMRKESHRRPLAEWIADGR